MRIKGSIAKFYTNLHELGRILRITRIFFRHLSKTLKLIVINIRI